MKVLSNQQNVKLQRHLDLDDKIEATENVEGLSYRPRTAETREVREHLVHCESSHRVGRKQRACSLSFSKRTSETKLIRTKFYHTKLMDFGHNNKY